MKKDNSFGDSLVVELMLKKSGNKLAAAKLDYKNKLYDDAVSRAYYAVYHCISAMLISRGLHFFSHSQTIGAFNKNFVKTGFVPALFTKMIKKLFDARQVGDYDFETSIDQEVAKECIANAEKIIDVCAKFIFGK